MYVDKTQIRMLLSLAQKAMLDEEHYIKEQGFLTSSHKSIKKRAKTYYTEAWELRKAINKFFSMTA